MGSLYSVNMGSLCRSAFLGSLYRSAFLRMEKKRAALAHTLQFVCVGRKKRGWCTQLCVCVCVCVCGWVWVCVALHCFVRALYVIFACLC
jgi:hypothetical protein